MEKEPEIDDGDEAKQRATAIHRQNGISYLRRELHVVVHHLVNPSGELYISRHSREKPLCRNALL